MKIQDLLEEANATLYRSVSGQLNLSLEENQDWREEVWVSIREGNKAVIRYCEIPFPKAAFTHELLHLDTQLKGFNRMHHGISLHKDTQRHMPTLVKVLDNDLQHHKMAKAFLNMGYPPEQFYGYENDPEVSHLREELSKVGHSLIYLSVLYLNFQSPLAGMKQAEKQALMNDFAAYAGGKYLKHFQRIDEILQTWINDEGYDPESYAIDFMTHLGIKDSWISYRREGAGRFEEYFPEAGFFVGNEFGLEEIAKVYGG